MEKSKKNLALMLLPASYIVLVLISTIMATKVSSIWGISMSTGVILFPVTFIIKDIIQKRLGRKVARISIWASAAAMIFASLLFWIGGILPPDVAHWHNQAAYIAILTPVLQVTIASILAGVVSELIDTAIFSAIFNRGHQYLASVVSNFVGITIDSLIFATLAFFGLPWSVIFGIFLTNMIVKFAMTMIGSPSIFLVKRSKTEEV